MKEIKFRAWDKENKRMIYPSGTAVEFIFAEGGFRGVQSSRLFVGSGFFELMQFTGLKDKNGKEIYEGDVINLFGRNGIRVASADNVVELADFLGGTYWIEHSPGGYKPIYEIIGNIYENPELLEARS